MKLDPTRFPGENKGILRKERDELERSCIYFKRGSDKEFGGKNMTEKLGSIRFLSTNTIDKIVNNEGKQDAIAMSGILGTEFQRVEKDLPQIENS